jgi:hypothetical protein
VFLFIYSDCTTYVDPHTIFNILLMFWLYFIFFITGRFVFSVFDSCC